MTRETIYDMTAANGQDVVEMCLAEAYSAVFEMLTDGKKHNQEYVEAYARSVLRAMLTGTRSWTREEIDSGVNLIVVKSNV